MYQTIEGFLQSWTYEAESTQKMLDALTDESLSQEIAPGHWTLGRVAWHIVTAIPVMLSGTGLKFEGETKDYPVPTSATTIADQYRKVNAAFVEALQSEWTDKDLATINDFFGRPMPNSIFLMTLINHQNHHRGQMTVLMRQAGLTVPGVYGPAKEEWAAAGMEAPKM
ncbi:MULTISPECIES: DinB family protein [Bacillus cereus group]|uniref:DinB family protein n=1 Tax=Bacillus cereus group TaxID=86661 RepID=UPI0024CC5604|nr:DinB family protein [Bacillus paranthracis]MED1682864.1 DinB family protein [Bacillus paranthracis]WAI28170.1 MAG: DinB family protein [Bacillus paranthracis]WAI34026.1 MAG: DinB family protein [Bacillus paranthracis]WAI37846.1 MAG: DinB family protein [Bacillus paranthracis]